MAMSQPTLVNVSVPDEAPPNNNFRIEATVKQGGPDPWASDGSCTTKKLDVAGWKLPVRLLVDGEQVDEREICLASGNKRTVTLSTSISDPGNHRIKVQAVAVGGNAYDLQPRKEEVNDDITSQITVSQDASDPSKPGPLDSVMKIVQNIASELGSSTTMVGVGAGAMVLLLVVVG